MNKDMMKKNLHAQVLLQPPACRLDRNGLVSRSAVEDDWWLIDQISDEGVRISDPRTGHIRLLGYDHIQKFTSDGTRDGAKRGFLTLHVQLFIQGNDVRIEPNSRPGEPVAAREPKIVERTVEFGYPKITDLAERLATQGYELGWARAENVQTRVELEGYEIVLEPESSGGLARFRTYDGLVLLKRRG